MGTVSVLRRPSSVLQLSQNLLSRFLSNFICGFPCALPQTVKKKKKVLKKKAFSNFGGLFFVFVLTMVTWDPMGAEFSSEWSSQKCYFGLLKF